METEKRKRKGDSGTSSHARKTTYQPEPKKWEERELVWTTSCRDGRFKSCDKIARFDAHVTWARGFLRNHNGLVNEQWAQTSNNASYKAKN